MLQYHFHWKTLSVAAGMTWWNFYFQIFEKVIGAVETVEFLLHLLLHLAGPLLTVWERLPAHRSRFVWDFIRDLKDLITIEYLHRVPTRLRSRTESRGIPLGALETSPTAERLFARSQAAQRGGAL